MTDFLAAIRQAYGDAVQASGADVTVNLIDRTQVTIPLPPARVETTLQVFVRNALTAYTGLVGDTARIKADANLSETGQAAALARPRAGSLGLTATVYAALAEYRGRVDAAEAKRYAAPSVPTSPTELSYSLARAREIRDVVRALEPAAAMRRLEAALDAARAGNAEAREFVAALLAPTFGDLGAVAEHAHKMWRQLVDVDDPAGRIALDDERAAIEWTERTLYQLAAHTRRAADLPDADVLRVVHATGGAGVYGYTAKQVALAELDAKHEKLRQQAA